MAAIPTSWQRRWQDYLFVLPALALIGAVVYGSIVYTAYVSAFRWPGFGPNKTFVGLANYIQLLRDQTFRATLANTAVFVLVFVTLQLAVGLLMAISVKVARFGATVCSVVFFLPVVLAHAVTAQVFNQILSNDGEVNAILRALGLPGLALGWLSDPDIALFSLAAVNLWTWAGFAFLFYFAALSQISPEIYEAAIIDGAGAARIVFRIVIPLLMPTHAALVMLGIIGSIKTFELVYLTTAGGPASATEFMTTYIVQKTIFEFNAGYGAAISMALIVIALALTVAQIVLLRPTKA